MLEMLKGRKTKNKRKKKGWGGGAKNSRNLPLSPLQILPHLPRILHPLREPRPRLCQPRLRFGLQLEQFPVFGVQMTRTVLTLSALFFISPKSKGKNSRLCLPHSTPIHHPPDRIHHPPAEPLSHVLVQIHIRHVSRRNIPPNPRPTTIVVV